MNTTPTFAALDIGSNGIRLAIAQPAPHKPDHPPYTIILQRRYPVRLGLDAFQSGTLSAKTINHAIDALRKFRTAIEQHQVQTYRAVATSAARSSRNIRKLIAAAEVNAQIHLEVITENEEAQLLLNAIKNQYQLSPRETTLIIDLGGGSIELILTQRNAPAEVSIKSFPLGPVRLLQQLQSDPHPREQLADILQNTAPQVRHWCKQKSTANTNAYAVGGNVEALAKSCTHRHDKKNKSQLHRQDLETIIPILQRMTLAEKIEKYHWRTDRADIIDIAAATLLMIMQNTNTTKLIVPKLSIRDGILNQLLHKINRNNDESTAT